MSPTETPFVQDAPLLTEEAESHRAEERRLRRFLVEVRDDLREIDKRTSATFDGHAVRALLELVEGEVGCG